MTGFIAMSREAFEHPIVGDGDRFRAWFWLVAHACWKPKKTKIKGELVVLERGELSFSQRFLAEKWGWSKSRVDRFLAELRDHNMIATRTRNGATAGHKAGQGQSVIYICNYEKYQISNENEWGNSGATAGQQRGNSGAKKNKGTIEEEPSGSSSSSARGHFSRKDWPEIPDWIPAEPWNGFVEMRRRKRASPTARAVRMIINKLEEFREDGHDPGAVLDQSTLKNWTDIFPIKDQSNDRSTIGVRDPRDGFDRAADRRLDPGHDSGFADPPERRGTSAGDFDRQGGLALPAPNR